MAKFDVVAWMAAYGKTGYQSEINGYLALIKKVEDTEGDYEHGMKMIDMYNEKIEVVRREAQDRYDDWVSDIDY